MYRPPIPRSPDRRLCVLGGVIVLLIGIWLGGHPSWLPSPLRSAFVSNNDDPLVNQVLDLLQSDYYRPLNRNQLVNKGLAGMVASLDDPYSHYYDPTDYQGFLNEDNPHLSGIGVDVQAESRGLLVDDVFPGSPAAKAGLQRGDVIVAVGATSLASRPANFGSQLIKGRAGTRVTLTILRGKQTHPVTLVRADIVVPVAAGEIVNYHGIKLGAVTLTQFVDGAGAELRAQVEKVLHQGARGLILDLRDNPGGLLNEAVNVASIFIPDGTIVSTDGRAQPTAGVRGQGRRDRDQHPDGRARRPRHRVGRRDRHRRAPGSRPGQGRRHAHLRQGRVPGDRAAPERRRARLHRRRVLHAERDQPRRRRGQGGRGITPDVYASTNPGAKTDTAFTVAERTVAAEVQ